MASFKEAYELAQRNLKNTCLRQAKYSNAKWCDVAYNIGKGLNRTGYTHFVFRARINCGKISP